MSWHFDYKYLVVECFDNQSWHCIFFIFHIFIAVTRTQIHTWYYLLVVPKKKNRVHRDFLASNTYIYIRRRKSFAWKWISICYANSCSSMMFLNVGIGCCCCCYHDLLNVVVISSREIQTPEDIRWINIRMIRSMPFIHSNRAHIHGNKWVLWTRATAVVYAKQC